MTNPRSDAQKYGLAAIVVGVLVLVLFKFLSTAYPPTNIGQPSAVTTTDGGSMSK